MTDIDVNMPGLEEASARLAEMEAADAAAAPQAQQSVSNDAGSHAAPTDDGQQQPGSTTTDTQATADAKTDATDTASKTEQKDQQPKQEASRYQKARERQDKSWAEINRQKEELKAEREKFDRERQEFESRRKTEPEAKHQPTEQAKKPTYSPEDYEKAAEQWEKEGKFDLADAAREKARDLRRNPPAAQPAKPQATEPDAEQAKALQREWWGKAAVDFPAVAKAGSPENAQLQEMLKAEPDLARHPKGLYLGARLVSAEAAAARVPVMEKELGELRAKVKELEQLTSPSVAGNPPQTGAQRSGGDEYAELQRLAEDIGTLR